MVQAAGLNQHQEVRMKRWTAAFMMVLGLAAGQVLAEEGQSKAISKTDYNADTKVLTVTFARGDVYEYADVPAEVAAELANAESKGKAFRKLIKGKYTGKKIAGPAETPAETPAAPPEAAPEAKPE
jgi:hypothetical protein